MLPAVVASEPGAGGADEPVPAGVFGAADWRSGDRGCGADRAADNAGCDSAWPEAGVAIFPAVVAVVPAAVVAIGRLSVGLIPIRLIAVGLALVAAGVGISRSLVLAIGIWIELRAIAGIGDHLLRHGRACERRGEDRGGAENFDFCHVISPNENERAKPTDGVGRGSDFGLCELQTGVKFHFSF